MKVQLIKETNPDGKIWFCVYGDDHIIDSFTEGREKEAREFFTNYGTIEPKIEVLETKEV